MFLIFRDMHDQSEENDDGTGADQSLTDAETHQVLNVM
jgi:hypothetical protein